MAKMNIVYKQLDELIPYEANAKTHPETQLANIAASLERYGWKQPVVIDRGGVIICGHGRVQAAQRSNVMREQAVPCVLADDLTPEEVAEFRIVDNKSAESPWDMDVLAEELKHIDLSAFDFDFGFDDEVSAAVVEDNYVPELPEDPKSHLGDIFQLGGAQADVWG
nr:MAG TPA: ParB protein [Caudoviricetes sp.]